MSDENKSLWDWLIERWKTPRWQAGVRLLASGALAALGGNSPGHQREKRRLASCCSSSPGCY